MKATLFYIFICLLIFSGIQGCKTAEVLTDAELPELEVSVENTAEVKDTEAVEPEEPVDEEIATETDIEEQIEEEPEVIVNEEGFAVTVEVYEATFDDIEQIIQDLNNIIQSNDYDTWLTYLTPGYIEYYSSTEVLKEQSEQALLKRYDIKLRSLKDYFKYAVVPSRSNARLDDLVFIDNEHLKAYMLIDNKPYILYLLEYYEENWKIGKF